MAGMASTSQHCSLQLGHPVQAAYGNDPDGALLTLASLSRCIHPQAESRASTAKELAGERCLVTALRALTVHVHVALASSWMLFQGTGIVCLP